VSPTRGSTLKRSTTNPEQLISHSFNAFGNAIII
jgi:hypothetical protein